MKMLDLFSGIGGFHLGLEQAGFKFDWVGFSEIDKHASKQYKRRFPNAKELGSITDVRCKDLPEHIDILCGGFPCQAFSIAGLRKGFDDTRGTLFFEIVRILRHYKERGNPIPYFILENVKGLLNHDDGRTFATIYRVLADLDYSVECELLNTRNFSCPQNRERIYIVGHLRGRGRSKIFPIGEGNCENSKTQGFSNNSQYSRTITTAHAHGSSTNMSYVGLKQVGTIGEDSEATRVYDPSGVSRTIKDGGGMGAKTGLYTVGIIPEEERPKGNWLPRERVLSDKGISRALSTSESQYPYYENNAKIRRLTPKECERLQGFPDGWTEGQSDTQRYKQLGNAVSVPVVKAVGERIINEIS